MKSVLAAALLVAAASAGAGAVSLALGGARAARAQVLPPPAPGEEIKTAALAELDVIARRVLQFAMEMPAAKYSWNPGEALSPAPPDPKADPYGRTVADLWLHMASLNFTRAAQLGAAPFPGYVAKGYETSTTDKAAIIGELSKSFDYGRSAIQKMSAADLARRYKIGNQEMTGNAALFAWLVDLNEYMGQTIAYGRMNGIIGTGPSGFFLRKPGQ